MAILIFVLALVLLAAAAASGYQSLNLLPTGIGVLYALAGAVAACAAVLAFAIALLIRRIDALARTVRESALPMGETSPAEMGSPAPLATEEEALQSGGEAVLESPEPKRPPSLIGSYSSAGANYKIFSDGSIEAETSAGTFKFASMADFKRHLAEAKGGREAGA